MRKKSNYKADELVYERAPSEPSPGSALDKQENTL